MTREEEIKKAAINERQITASQMCEGVYSIDEIPNATEVLLFDDIAEGAFKWGVEWADKHPKSSASMTTDELLDKLPKEIYAKDFEERFTTNEYNTCGKLKLFYMNRWVARYENSLGGVFCLNPTDKNAKTVFFNAVGYGDTPREAIQQLYDWCVKNLPTESFRCG